MNGIPGAGDVRRDVLRVLEQASHRSVYTCYQCGKCTASCPFGFSPQRVMRYLQLGQLERALSMETTWVCASCLTCSRLCPKDADPAGVMKALRSLRSRAPGVEPAGSATGGERREWQELTDLAAEQFHRHARPLRSQVFANIHDISRRGSRLAPLSNWATRVPGSRLAAHHLLGIHKARSMPEFVRPSFPEWFARREPQGDGHRGEVLLFHDTFMDFNAPQVGVATTELLELAGHRVALTDSVCCGRPMISKGYMAQAERQARINVERLHRQVVDGAWIVGCEPSCLLTVREEYPRMLAGTELEARARAVAERSLLIDEFLVRARDAGELDLRLATDDGRQVLFHGHCQQKAEADAGLSLELLRMAGFAAEMVRAPCCGMAGAFGFEREHYEASRSAFERALGPALASSPDARLVVMGISCRKQIEHFTGRPVSHLVEVLRESVRPADEPVIAFAASPT